MDLIRLYYNSLDIQPVALLHHFLRFLGFYTEELSSENGGTDVESAADIYLISHAYMRDRRTALDIKNEEKSILIFKDGWDSNNNRVRAVYYEPEEDERFLTTFAKTLIKIIEKRRLFMPNLIQNSEEWKISIQQITKEYLKNDLLRASLFTKRFYRQRNLYRMARDKYLGFVDAIETFQDTSFSNDLLRYTLIYAKYEMDLISKDNLLEYYYPAEELLEECRDLLQDYEENEELQLLKADIIYELQGKWLRGCNEYANPYIEHCAYSDFKRGKIFRLYLEEYDNAELILERAVEKKEDYYYAWYQLGLCYEERGKYRKAINSYTQIRSILNDKYEEHLLSPVEMEYLYKAVLRIATVYENRGGAYRIASAYNDQAKKIRREHAIDAYLDLLWGDDMDEGLRPVIDEMLQERVAMGQEQIY